MSSPGDIPPLRVLYNAPVLRALPTIHGDGIAVDFEGFSFFVYLSGEEETATRFTLTPEVPGALELVATRCHAGGADIIVMPRVATAVLAAVGATPYFLHGHPGPRQPARTSLTNSSNCARNTFTPISGISLGLHLVGVAETEFSHAARHSP